MTRNRAFLLLALAAGCGAVAYWGNRTQSGVAYFATRGSHWPSAFGYLGAILGGCGALMLESCKHRG